MNTKATRIILTLLLLLSGSFASSCSTEPTIQSDDVKVEQAKDKPKPLDDVIVASEDEVPTWDESADKTNSPSEKADPDK